ncbi:type II secretion system protein F (GspF) [Geothermobacter ehrlichii]|uniref:General secretion pathway protein F n=1 Tax=Geothermobacter ehrlichii TaxID=213224 RepID=A0A5D3WIG4_9BACT|nr:type II secretion system inner membrane protein GspF [Geothermobacter ehrlichii]TYO97563.1 type II secretion system protein F (GspF) [Geothermobacter ehrlichii]
MPIFDYSGFDSQGKKVSGSLEAAGRRAAIAQLRQQGTFPTELREQGVRQGRRGILAFRRGVSAEDLAMATRQFATLLGAGLSLDEALGTVAGQQTNPRLKAALAQTREKVVQGDALYRALAAQRRLFPDVYISMVEVGENSGDLDRVLGRLADYLEDRARLQARLTSALAYPLLMLLVGCGVLFFLVSYVLPNITRMLTELDIPLPLATRLLIRTSGFFHDFGWLVLPLLFGGLILLRRYGRTEGGRLRLDRLLLRLPLFGRLNLLLATARFSRTTATLLQSGLPLLRCLELGGRLIGNRLLASAVAAAADRVREGESLAEALRREDVFPDMLPQMIAIGERSGELENMLFRVADSYERQVEMTIDRLLALLEPAMILLMALAVGFIVLAILLPIFQASQGLG